MTTLASHATTSIYEYKYISCIICINTCNLVYVFFNDGDVANDDNINNNDNIVDYDKSYNNNNNINNNINNKISRDK